MSTEPGSMLTFPLSIKNVERPLDIKSRAVVGNAYIILRTGIMAIKSGSSTTAEQKDPIHCPECGREPAGTEQRCPHCGAAIDISAHDGGDDNGAWVKWNREGDKIKNQWVIAVVAFWITVAIQVLVYFYHKELNFILLSIAGGMMVLGVWLKLRLKLHLRKEPQKPQ